MKLNLSTYLPLLFLLALLVTACKDDTLPASPAEEEEEEAGSGVYVSVVVNTGGSNASRVPTPGENGDGPQAGTVEESRVYDLNVFFFQGEGINDLDNPNIDCQLYFSGAELQTSNDNVYHSVAKKVTDVLLLGETYHVLVIANTGSRITGVNTLHTLRDYQIEQPVTDNYTNFLMSSESDVEVTITPSTQNNPVPVEVDVERMVARVDCAWENEYEVSGDNMPSEGGNPSQNEKDKVKILGAALVNRYVGNTYAFKRVMPLMSNEIIYLGNEETFSRVYVLDPLTDPITFSNKDNSDYTYYYTEFVNWNVETDFQNPFSETVTSTHEGTDYTRWAYARENVNIVDDNFADLMERFVTGIMFQAQYTPAGFTEGETFYVYPTQENRKIYTAEALSKDYPDLFKLEDIASWGTQATKCEVYSKGRCYYVYWIRHADDENTTVISPMEYAIVRNNIYQLKINSISKLGTPEPDSNVEEVEPNIHIRVKSWNMVEVEVPAFD